MGAPPATESATPPTAADTAPTAASRALRVPELVSRIFEYIALDRMYNYRRPKADGSGYDYLYGRLGVLSRCSQVNRLWFAEAIRLLWRSPGVRLFGAHLSRIFEPIAPERRQMYANCVEMSSEKAVAASKAGSMPASLRGLHFPRLRVLRLLVDDGDAVPEMEPVPAVRILELQPRVDGDDDRAVCTPDQFDALFDKIPKLFPNVEDFSFLDQVDVNKGALQRLRDSLPRLEYMVDQFVEEVTKGVTPAAIRPTAVTRAFAVPSPPAAR